LTENIKNRDLQFQEVTPPENGKNPKIPLSELISDSAVTDISQNLQKRSPDISNVFKNQQTDCENLLSLIFQQLLKVRKRAKCA